MLSEYRNGLLAIWRRLRSLKRLVGWGTATAVVEGTTSVLLSWTPLVVTTSFDVLDLSFYYVETASTPDQSLLQCHVSTKGASISPAVLDSSVSRRGVCAVSSRHLLEAGINLLHP